MGKREQNVATYCNILQNTAQGGNMWQHVRTANKLYQNVGICGPSVKTPFCPDPVWKPVGTFP